MEAALLRTVETLEISPAPFSSSSLYDQACRHAHRQQVIRVIPPHVCGGFCEVRVSFLARLFSASMLPRPRTRDARPWRISDVRVDLCRHPELTSLHFRDNSRIVVVRTTVYGIYSTVMFYVDCVECGICLDTEKLKITVVEQYNSTVCCKYSI